MRNYKRKTNRASIPKDIVMTAVKAVVEDGNSCKAMAKVYNIPLRSLHTYCKKYKEIKETKEATTSTDIDINIGYDQCKTRSIFTEYQEEKLEKYLIKYSNIYFGISPKEARKLAYQYAVAIQNKVPDNWMKNKMAGEDWLSRFMKNHKKLNIRTPKEASLTRVTGFNRNNAQLFFNNLKDILRRFNVQPINTWNMDEIGVLTIQKPNKVIRRRIAKQISFMTTAKKGQHVTLACTVSATGDSIPPFFVFPRVHFKDYFIRFGPMGCAGAANLSGWMNEDTFLLYITHFIKYTRPSKDNRVLLLLDNHDSHLSIKALNIAKENGIVILSFPSHCSYRMQPLDISGYGPLKKYINSAMDTWMHNNQEKKITIHDIPKIIKDVLPLALTPLNITAGFSKTGRI
ncbi:uncharacterized protein LOC105833706 isoform X2 [Monomorium pharaonis]|uniref:uncharacterized protein LOC105833706 isoform X2 n=1 Tax=Monomorium pharaonis TaxID=307658 RepID=UPI00063F9142|nr:uncharacterized protein LOC105833706 isoform X2 [Monomorium pharaonis]XP_036141810.1 uncharacterized protein LOC105833706 isoform X2 [Monomorium pharaonis]XP_036141812.1 uncharacterized protein LOC105833706 isoform X2 [Monomorium pharaonis]